MESGSPPWGKWFVLHDAPDFKVKRIEVAPGRRLSYQKHFRRNERWEVIRGKAKVTLDGVDIFLGPGDGITIPVEVLHRVESVGPGDLVFVEIQRGDYFGEDDIVRVEDDYGRGP